MDDLDTVDVSEHVRQRGHESRVDLDRDDTSDGTGQREGERADSGADLEHDIVGSETRRGDDASDRVRIDEQMLAIALAHRESVPVEQRPRRARGEQRAHRRPSRREQAGQAPQPCRARTPSATSICCSRVASEASPGKPSGRYAFQVRASNCRPPW